MFIGSGDLLNRNTQRRVEAFAEVRTEETRAQVLEVMEALRSDDVRGWDMQPDGSYRRAEEAHGADSQERLSAFFARQHVEALPQEKQKRIPWFRRVFGGAGRTDARL